MIDLGIYRVKKNANYVVMNRTALNDNRLTWKAKGIIAYMLSMPDDWKFYISELITHAQDGEKSFRSGLDELKKCGYVRRFPIYEENKISHWETVIYESPQGRRVLAENLHVQNVDVENVDVENEGLLSNDSLPNTDVKPSIESNVPFAEIVDHLNKKTGKKFKTTTSSTKKDIKARWNQGFDVDDFKKVIDIKTGEWLNDPKMSKYLRPQTLFGTKFEGYLNQEDDKPDPNDPYDNLF